jgi:hypothetical protein
MGGDYVFERMAKQLLNPTDTMALAYHFWLKDYPGAFVRTSVTEEFSPFNTANT